VKKTMMMTTAIAAVALLASSSAWAEELTDAEWHLKFDDCLSIDQEGPNHDGEQFCVKDGKGMSKAQQDAWLRGEIEKTGARMRAEAAPGYKNCMRELDDFDRYRIWYGPPSVDACVEWFSAFKQKGVDMMDKAAKEIMEVNNAQDLDISPNLARH
jgi:hypothetical protein